MAEVVKEIENIIKVIGLNPNSESATIQHMKLTRKQVEEIDPQHHMTENNPKTHYPSAGGSSSSSSSSSGGDDGPKKFSGAKRHMNPPEREIPDAATLRDQWRYAIRQYSKWYSHAWGTAILAGTAFFALGWIIKGENPIPSFHSNNNNNNNNNPSSSHTHQKDNTHS